MHCDISNAQTWTQAGPKQVPPPLTSWSNTDKCEKGCWQPALVGYAAMRAYHRGSSVRKTRYRRQMRLHSSIAHGTERQLQRRYPQIEGKSRVLRHLYRIEHFAKFIPYVVGHGAVFVKHLHCAILDIFRFGSGLPSILSQGMTPTTSHNMVATAFPTPRLPTPSST